MEDLARGAASGQAAIRLICLFNISKHAAY